jgi:TfuA-like protein
VIHGPPETGYVALSEAMVNIRASLAQAERDSVIEPATRDALAALAKGLFYHDRSYERLLALAAEAALPASQVAGLRGWLPGHRINQKRLDAKAMLGAMQALLAGDAGPKQVDYELEWTEAWDDATLAAAGSKVVGGADATWLSGEQILDELRLNPAAYPVARDRTLLRLLARREAQRRHQPGDQSLQRAALDRLRARQGLFRRVHLERWLEENDLDGVRLEQLIADEACLDRLVAEAGDGLDDRLLDDLRLEGDYGRLAARARAKQALLAAQGLDHARPEDVGVTPAALLVWYFEHRLSAPLPDDLDAALREQGFQGPDHFYRALLHEWLYCRETRP